jgi:methylenetetrahydrofolate dehydrogenase (NADP+)/methenyltetrahydrofolate cyclohydrolase
VYSPYTKKGFLMAAILMDTRSTAAAMRLQVKAAAETLRQEAGQQPTLVLVAVGEDASIYDYIRVVTRTAAQVGIRAFAHILPSDIGLEEFGQHIAELNRNPQIHAISLQTPLPDHLPLDLVSGFLDPAKDVEGFHPANIGQYVLGQSALVPPPALSGMKLLSLYSINPEGRHVVIVGRNPVIGKPLANLLTNADATVTLCHSKTHRLTTFTKAADILIVAVQRPHFFSAEMVRAGSVVIDFGINYVKGKVLGDVDTASVQVVAGAITPMPSGTGPLTVIHLLQNVVQAASQRVASS